MTDENTQEQEQEPVVVAPKKAKVTVDVIKATKEATPREGYRKVSQHEFDEIIALLGEAEGCRYINQLEGR